MAVSSRNWRTKPYGYSIFNLDAFRYGGLYRNVILTYVPAVSLERVLIDAHGPEISLSARLRNPPTAPRQPSSRRSPRTRQER